MAVPHQLLLALRTIEALVMSMLAGLFVAVAGRLFLPIPLLPAAILGFLAGGTTMLRTLGVAVERRRARVVLAVFCALIAWTTVRGINYALFRDSLQRNYRATDYRLTVAQIDARIDASLFDLTGSKGIVGYTRVAVNEGAIVGLGVSLKGKTLLGYGLVELLLVLGVAVGWAYGPTARRRQVTTTEGSET